MIKKLMRGVTALGIMEEYKNEKEDLVFIMQDGRRKKLLIENLMERTKL